MAASLNLPQSPVHEMRTFDPPSLVPNPWEDLGSWVPVDDEGEDYEGEEEYDEEQLPFLVLGAKGGVNLVDGSPYLYLYLSYRYSCNRTCGHVMNYVWCDGLWCAKCKLLFVRLNCGTFIYASVM
jgi:hypothetical protein